MIGFVEGDNINNSAPDVKTCKSLFDTRCLICCISPTFAVISKASLSYASPISKLKYCPDLLAHIPSGCPSVPANHNLF